MNGQRPHLVVLDEVREFRPRTYAIALTTVRDVRLAQSAGDVPQDAQIISDPHRLIGLGEATIYVVHGDPTREPGGGRLDQALDVIHALGADVHHVYT